MSDNYNEEITATGATDEATEAVAEAPQTENAPVGEPAEETVTADEPVSAEETTAEKPAPAVEENSADDKETKSLDYNNDIDDGDEDDEELFTKNGKKKKKPLTHAQKKKRRITALISVCSVILALGIFISGIAIANPLIVKGLIAQAKNYKAVVYDQHEQLEPVKEDGYWTFTTDKEFKVLQFTDVHIGAGSFSKQKDMWAMNAVATMIRAEQPDLVVVTGDIAYPVPFQAGTFNNLAATQVFANMMEKLEVYWTFAFGNHDTEAYSMKTRDDICKWYESQEFKYCLFERGFADDPKLKLKEDDIGYGNNIIRVKNSNGIYTQAIVTFDSHSYIEGDYFGAEWKYANIHDSQINWYADEMQKLVAANKKIDPNSADTVKNLAFFHIPLVEYREAWGQIIESKVKNLTPGQTITGNNGLEVTYHYGKMGESDSKKNGQRTYGVFCGIHEDDLFEVGFDNGLQGTFTGHDHYNNFSVTLKKDGKEMRLTYGMSIDYLAYPGIYKEHLQRGCTVITVDPDGSFDCVAKNYYTDYKVAHEKG